MARWVGISSDCVCECLCLFLCFNTGVTMKLMDEVAGIVAARHCNTNIVTASVDPINFHRKIQKGKGIKGYKRKRSSQYCFLTFCC